MGDHDPLERFAQRTSSERKSVIYKQGCSASDHGLGQKAPWRHKLKSWSWSCTLGSWMKGVGLG